MVRVQIINIFSVMIGIGRLIQLSETIGLTSGELQGAVEAIHYHITTQFWDLTGNYQNLMWMVQSSGIAVLICGD